MVALAAAQRGLPVEFHTPSEVKAAVTGSGRADKAQVTAMVTKLLGLKVAPKPADAADALALAICHLWRAPMRTAGGGAGQGGRAGPHPQGAAGRRPARAGARGAGRDGSSVRAEIVRVGWKNEIKGSPSRGDACASVKSGGTR